MFDMSIETRSRFSTSMCRSLLQLALAASLALAVLLALVSSTSAEGQIYIVKPGENLSRIASRYGVSVQAIQAANGLNNYNIYAGQALIIPVPGASAIPMAPPANSGGTPNITHIVQPGETLFLIGLRYGLLWTRIQAANGLPSERVYAGQSLIIPVGKASRPAEMPTPEPTATAAAELPAETATPAATEDAATATPPAGTTHTVQHGETLFSIGLKYDLLWTTIQKANGLPDATIYSGQQLFIPASNSGYGLPAVVAPPPPPGTGRRFLVVLSEQRLYAYDNDQMVRSTLISSGVAQYPTVTGTFYIYLRYASARMIGPGYDLPNVPYVMYFYQSYGLHGTYWHSNFGHPMSHGCVNMPTSEAEWAYNWSTYGTPVIIRY